MNYCCIAIRTTRVGSGVGRTKALVLACACLMSTGAVLAQSEAGVVKKSQGSVLILREGKNIPASVGTKVMAGDVLRTADASSAGVMLKDETRISLGANSQVTLDKYVFNANSHTGGMLVSVFKGTLMMISGLLVKTNPGAVTVKTPTATAGIRGTEFIVEVP